MLYHQYSLSSSKKLKGVECSQTPLCKPISQLKKNYTSLINKDAEILMSANRLQCIIKKIIHHDEVGIISEMQEWFNMCKSVSIIQHTNRSKVQNHMIIQIQKGWQSPTPFLIKNPKENGNRGTIPEMIKAMCGNPVSY